MSTDVHATAAARLRGAGQRYTPQRRRLVSVLAGADHPVALPEILATATELKQSSAYRNLADLEQASVVRRVTTDEGYGRYELTEELTSHHHHLICRSCGRVEDIGIPPGLERSLDDVLGRLAARAGFADASHRLDLIGTCRTCVS